MRNPILLETRAQLQNLYDQHKEDIPLLEGLALIAREEDQKEPYQAILDRFQELKKGLRISDTGDIFQSIARLSIHFFQNLGFEGDREDYYSPSNSVLHKVIERRRGQPILLSALYISLGHSVGIPLQAIGFPGHFLDGVADPLFFIDPINGGRIIRIDDLKRGLKRESEHISSEEIKQYVQPITTRQLLIRVNNNLIRAYQKIQSPNAMLRAIDRNLILFPEHLQAHRAKAILLKGMGRYKEAATSLEIFVAAHPDDPQAEELIKELDLLRGLS